MQSESQGQPRGLGAVFGSKALMLPLAAAVLAALTIVIAAGWQLAGAAQAQREVAAASDRVDRIAETAQDLTQLVVQAESHQRGYHLVGREEYAEAALAARATSEALLQDLEREARDGGLDLHQLPTIRSLADRRFDYIENTIALERAGRPEEARAIIREGQGARVTAELKSVVGGLIDQVQGERETAAYAREGARHNRLLLEVLLVILVVAGFSMAAVSAVRGRLAAQRTGEALRAANAEMTRARLEADAANAAKSRFLAAASHDMRQPLHALSLYLASLGRRVETADGQRILGNMDAAVRAMTRMFSALLDLARLEAGVLRPEIATFALGPLLADVGHQAAEVDADRAGRVTVMPTRLETRSDPDLLEIVLRNLAVNAVKYAGDGRVLIGCRRTRDGVRIEVHDSGPGIPPERLQDLFGEFVRGDTTRSIEGLGLGLSIVDRLARLLDHPIQVRSEPGRGSVFSVTAPRASGSRHEGRAGGDGDLAGARILLVDDERLVLDAMAVALTDAGAVVTPAASTAEALERLDQPFDLHILDLALAGRSGLELLAEIEDRRGGPVRALIVTGSTSPEPLNLLRASGRPWVTKPVSAAQLVATAAGLLRP